MNHNKSLSILGMHRSGTSAMSAVIAELGVFLGPESDLAPAKPDNPDGFFEHLKIVEINDRLLSKIGSAWDFLPGLPRTDWRKICDSNLVNEARGILEDLRLKANGKTWGWKDPRATITWQFWDALMPGTRIVGCVRHPLGVAESLRRRGGNSLTFGIWLWMQYNIRLLNLVKDCKVACIVEYDNLLDSPKNEIARICSCVGLIQTENVLLNAASVLKPSYRHHRYTYKHGLEVLGMAEAMELYANLAKLAVQQVPLDYDKRLALNVLSEIGKLPFNYEPVAGFTSTAIAVSEKIRRQQEQIADLQHIQKLIGSEPFYRIGEKIDFSIGGNSQIYLRGGCYPPETSGSWMRERTARVELVPTELSAKSEGSGMISLELKAFQPADSGTGRLSVSVNGTTLASKGITTTEYISLQLHILSGGIVVGRRMIIEISIEELFVPSEHGLSRDSRPLGHCLIALRITADE